MIIIDHKVVATQSELEQDYDDEVQFFTRASAVSASPQDIGNTGQHLEALLDDKEVGSDFLAYGALSDGSIDESDDSAQRRSASLGSPPSFAHPHSHVSILSSTADQADAENSISLTPPSDSPAVLSISVPPHSPYVENGTVHAGDKNTFLDDLGTDSIVENNNIQHGQAERPKIDARRCKQTVLSISSSSDDDLDDNNWANGNTSSKNDDMLPAEPPTKPNQTRYRSSKTVDATDGSDTVQSEIQTFTISDSDYSDNDGNCMPYAGNERDNFVNSSMREISDNASLKQVPGVDELEQNEANATFEKPGEPLIVPQIQQGRKRQRTQPQEHSFLDHDTLLEPVFSSSQPLPQSPSKPLMQLPFRSNTLVEPRLRKSTLESLQSNASISAKASSETIAISVSGSELGWGCGKSPKLWTKPFDYKMSLNQNMRVIKYHFCSTLFKTPLPLDNYTLAFRDFRVFDSATPVSLGLDKYTETASDQEEKPHLVVMTKESFQSWKAERVRQREGELLNSDNIAELEAITDENRDDIGELHGALETDKKTHLTLKSRKIGELRVEASGYQSFSSLWEQYANNFGLDATQHSPKFVLADGETLGLETLIDDCSDLEDDDMIEITFD